MKSGERRFHFPIPCQTNDPAPAHQQLDKGTQIGGMRTDAVRGSALMAFEHIWVEALQKNDVNTLSNILVPTYVDTDETGHQGDRAAGLGALRSGALKMSLIELCDMKPVIYGQAAVVTGQACSAGHTRDNPSQNASCLLTPSFVSENGEDRCIAAHGRSKELRLSEPTVVSPLG